MVIIDGQTTHKQTKKQVKQRAEECQGQKTAVAY